MLFLSCIAVLETITAVLMLLDSAYFFLLNLMAYKTIHEVIICHVLRLRVILKYDIFLHYLTVCWSSQRKAP